MKKKIFRHLLGTCLFLSAPFAAYAEEGNPNTFFGDKENQIRLTIGQSVRPKFEDLYIASLIYSQPGTFFACRRATILKSGDLKERKTPTRAKTFHSMILPTWGLVRMFNSSILGTFTQPSDLEPT